MGLLALQEQNSLFQCKHVSAGYYVPFWDASLVYNERHRGDAGCGLSEIAMGNFLLFGSGKFGEQKLRKRENGGKEDVITGSGLHL